MKRYSVLLIPLILLFSLVLTACNKPSTSEPTSAPNQSAVVDGKTLLETRCTACHTLDRVNEKQATADQWQATVTKMISNGAKLTNEEEAILVQYLADNFK